MAKKILFVIFMIVSLTGCATVKPLDTSTGKPEVIITDASKKDIADAIVNTMLSWDFQLQKRDEYILVFGKKDTNIASSVLLGSRYDAVPEWRFTYNMVDYAGGVRIIANIASVTNPGSAFERITDFSKGSQDAQNVQKFFRNLKNELEFKKIYERRRAEIQEKENELKILKSDLAIYTGPDKAQKEHEYQKKYEAYKKMVEASNEELKTIRASHGKQ